MIQKIKIVPFEILCRCEISKQTVLTPLNKLIDFTAEKSINSDSFDAVNATVPFSPLAHYTNAISSVGKILTLKNEAIRRRSGVFIVSLEHIAHLFLLFLFLTLNK